MKIRTKTLVFVVAVSVMLLMQARIAVAQDYATGTQDDTSGVWMFDAAAPTSDIIKTAISYDIFTYVGDSREEVYDFGYGPSEPPGKGEEDTTLSEVVEGLLAVDDFGYFGYVGDDVANFDTGSEGYFFGGFDRADPLVIVSDGIVATGELGPSGAANAVEAERAIEGYEIFIFEDGELSGMTITLSNSLGLSITLAVEDLQVNPPTPNGADDIVTAIDLDALPGFDSTVDFIEAIRIQDDGITSPSKWGDTTLEIDAIAVRKSVMVPRLHVIPEVALGTILVLVGMFGSLGVYMVRRKSKQKSE